MLPGIGAILAGVSSARLVTYQELKSSTSSESTYTFSDATIGAAADGRVVIAGIAWNHEGAAPLTSATIGGVSASILVQTDGGGISSALISAVVPTGTTADVVVNIPNGASGCSAGIWTATGLTSAAAFATASDTALSALNVSTSPSGFLIAVAVNDSSRTFTWSGATEDYDSNYDATNVASGASIAVDGGTVTVTPTASGAVTDACVVAASF